jgi:PAX-interacting protein 1
LIPFLVHQPDAEDLDMTDEISNIVCKFQVNSISSKALSASVSEIGSVVNLADSMAGSVPVYGSKGSVSEDLGVTSKTNPVARYFSMGCSTFGMRKVKRSTKAVPLNDKTPASPKKSASESTTFCPNKKPRIQVCQLHFQC